jgi:dihydroceramide fatty acyl 2-hydroxylase
MSQDATTAVKDTAMADDYGVDYTRPVFSQLEALGDQYWEWVHIDLQPSQRRQLAAAQPQAAFPGSFRVFESAWLEANTHISWRLILALWVPTVVLMLAAARWLGLGWAGLAGAACGGLLLWTLVEYVLHRVVFHHEPRNTWERKFHFLAHGIHHKDPWDPTRLVFPPLAGYGITLVLFVGIRLVLPLAPALAALAGLLIGYLGYDLGHFAWHHARCARGWPHFLKRYHLAHHHKDMNSHFGVSQPLWDLVFRTYGPRRCAAQSPA